MALEFARAHDQEVWECLCDILTVSTGPESAAGASTTLPLAMGGLGLRSAERTRWPAYWASWADTLPMIRRGTQKWRISSCTTWKEGPLHHAWVQLAGPPQPWMSVDGFEVPSWVRGHCWSDARPSWKWRTGNLVSHGRGGSMQLQSGSSPGSGPKL